MTERVHPHDADAERTILGAVLVDNAALESAMGLIQQGDFYRAANGRIFAAMVALGKREEPVDPLTLKAELNASKDLEKIGGAAYIADLMDGVPRVSNLEPWCRIVQAHSVRRRLVRMASGLADAAYDLDRDPDDVIAKGMEHFVALSRRLSPGDWLDNAALYTAALVEIEKQSNDPDGIMGLRTGIQGLDKKLQGIRPGQLGIIGGRLKTGKSLLAGQIGERVAEAGGRVRVFTLEMSGVQMTKRRIGSIARVAVNQLHYLSPAEREKRWARICGNVVVERVRDGRLQLATSARRVDQMAAMLSREQAKAPLSLVVVDYLQLVEAQGKHRARNEAIAEVSASLKRMALDLDVPVIAVAQLNRAPEARSGKAPTMADLADSDALGRDCDWAILIHRDPPAPKGATNEPGTADLIVDANRDGYTGKVRVMLNPVSLQFEEQEVVEYGQQATA
jgi:replicative DNA helicase